MTPEQEAAARDARIEKFFCDRGVPVAGKAPSSPAVQAAAHARDLAGLQQEITDQKQKTFWRQQADLGNLHEPKMSAEREAAIRKQFNLPPKN